MSQLILNVKDKRKLPFLKELLKQMKFVEVVDSEVRKPLNKKKQFLNNLDQAVDFVNEYKEGRTKAKPFNQLLDELLGNSNTTFRARA